MVKGGYDVAIRVGEVIERDMIAVRLGPDLRQVVVASPDYPMRHGAPASPSDLKDHRCIRWHWPGYATPYNWEFWEDGRWFDVAVNGPLIVNSRDLERQAALAGVGLAFVVEQMVMPLIAKGRLVPLLRQWSAPFPGFFLYYPEQRQMAPALRAFIDQDHGDDPRLCRARHKRGSLPWSEQIELPAQQHELAEGRLERGTVVAPEVGDGLEVGLQVPQQPD